MKHFDHSRQREVVSILNAAGEIIPTASFTSTEAKNEFSRLLELVGQGHMAVITRHDAPKAVVLSVAEFNALAQGRQVELSALTAEFDELLMRMQKPSVRTGLKAAFDAGPTELEQPLCVLRVDVPEKPCIYVLAGTNGAGKSSIGGATIRSSGGEYFNPDEAALRIRQANPGLSLTESNSLAWNEGKRLLERAVADRCTFAFETTLGGHTMVELLESALKAGLEVRVWYVGLETPELHIQRVRARVATGGHDIPEDKIRERFDSGRLNLCRILLRLTEVRVFDNSQDSDPISGKAPRPWLLLHMKRGRVVSTCNLSGAPQWVRPILAIALKR